MMTGRDVLALCRPRISLAVAGASLFGALLAGGGQALSVACAVAGAGALCAGCSALNQVQERRRDGLMARTADRPLPSQRVSVGEAVAVFAALSLIGLALFALSGGLPLLAMGVAVLFIYNGLYTPLKPVTPAALLVGALAGALPPYTGWLAAGGEAESPVIWAVVGLVYLWQVPHFWLLAARRRSEYERAGFPVLAAALPPGAYRMLTALWVLAYFIGLCLALALASDGRAGAMGLSASLAVGVGVAAVAASGRESRALALVHCSMPPALVLLLLAAWPY